MKIHLQKKNFVPPKFWKYQHDTEWMRLKIANGTYKNPQFPTKLHFFREFMFPCVKLWNTSISHQLMDVSFPSKTASATLCAKTDEISSKTWAFDHTPGSERRFGKINDFHCHYLGVSENRGTPKWMVKRWKTLSKWMIWGYHYFRKHPSSWWFCTTEPAATIGENKRAKRSQMEGFHPWVGGKNQQRPTFPTKRWRPYKYRLGGSTKNVNCQEKMWPNKLKMYHIWILQLQKHGGPTPSED